MPNQVLVDELTNDPLARGYTAMSAQAKADSLNTINRDATASPSAILDYMMKTEFRNSTLYGRVAFVAALQPDPVTGSFGNVPTGAVAALVAMTNQMVSSAKAMIRLTSDQGGVISTPLTNTELTNILTNLDTNNAQCMSIANKNAIIGLSQNQQSRATELGLPFVKLGNIENLDF